MAEYLSTRAACTERLILAVGSDPWLARYALAQCCLFMELGSLNELVDLVEAADRELVERDKDFFEKLVRERFGF